MSQNYIGIFCGVPVLTTSHAVIHPGLPFARSFSLLQILFERLGIYQDCDCEREYIPEASTVQSPSRHFDSAVAACHVPSASCQRHWQRAAAGTERVGVSYDHSGPDLLVNAICENLGEDR